MYKAPREAGTAENSGDQPASCLRRSARRPKASFTYPSFTPVCCHSRFQAVRQLGAQSGHPAFYKAATQPIIGSTNCSSLERTLATSPYWPSAAIAPVKSRDCERPKRVLKQPLPNQP